MVRGNAVQQFFRSCAVRADLIDPFYTVAALPAVVDLLAIGRPNSRRFITFSEGKCHNWGSYCIESRTDHTCLSQAGDVQIECKDGAPQRTRCIG